MAILVTIILAIFNYGVQSATGKKLRSKRKNVPNADVWVGDCLTGLFL
jgi:hypothetical protein